MRSIRVASIPAGHPYVLHLADPDVDDGVERLPDIGDPWWPPRMLSADWITNHAEDFDVMHVHFGFDFFEPGALDAVAAALRAFGKPLVMTVHDLRNPHHLTSELHDTQLATLLANAAVVTTLTESAAREIDERFGRTALVVPHPHIVELGELRARQARRRRSSGVVGIHLKSLRPNMEPAIVDAALEAVSSVAGAELRIDVHCDVAHDDGARHDDALMHRLRAAERAGRLTLYVHDYFDDGQLLDYLEGLHASVLPYRFGTHSGWLEACRDLGVAVVAPDCGHYADQGEVVAYRCNETVGLDHDSCVAAIRTALERPRPAPVPWTTRVAQRRQIAAAHRTVYLDALRSVAPPRVGVDAAGYELARSERRSDMTTRKTMHQHETPGARRP